MLIFCFPLINFYHLFCTNKKHVLIPIFVDTNSPEEGLRVEMSRGVFSILGSCYLTTINAKLIHLNNFLFLEAVKNKYF